MSQFLLWGSVERMIDLVHHKSSSGVVCSTVVTFWQVSHHHRCHHSPLEIRFINPRRFRLAPTSRSTKSWTTPQNSWSWWGVKSATPPCVDQAAFSCKGCCLSVFLDIVRRLVDDLTCVSTGKYEHGSSIFRCKTLDRPFPVSGFTS